MSIKNKKSCSIGQDFLLKSFVSLQLHFLDCFAIARNDAKPKNSASLREGTTKQSKEKNKK